MAVEKAIFAFSTAVFYFETAARHLAHFKKCVFPYTADLVIYILFSSIFVYISDSIWYNTLEWISSFLPRFSRPKGAEMIAYTTERNGLLLKWIRKLRYG